MQRRVRQLPDRLANQIAAGEVVARPASVVKELIENAVDAGATTIVVEVEAGGVALVRVVDDGRGIHPEDVSLALERHATSKIDCVDDLRAIMTLGFRGEALPSIASVSRFRLRTRRAEDDAGTEAEVEGGGATRIGPCASAPGTSVEVAELFYNVPARRKFLRALATEAAHVSEVVKCAALANHEVQFELSRDGRLVRRWLSMPTVGERVSDVLNDVELMHFHGLRGPLRIEAFLSSPERARTGATGLYLFVNRRPVQDRAIARAVASAYGDALERGRFPVGALFIEMPAELVDVNVHPQKAEVRFAEARALTGSIHSVVRDAVAAEPRSETRLPVRGTPSEDPQRWEWRDSGAADPSPRDVPEENMPDSRLVGVARGRYLLCDTPEGIVVISVERARTLVLTKRAEAELARGRLVSQRLLFPLIRDVGEKVADRLEAEVDAFERVGFDVRRSGPSVLAVHGVPKLFAHAPAERLFDALIGLGALEPRRLVDTFAAITAGAEPALDDTEARALLAALGDLSAEAVVASIDYADLEP
jgi:DNA mismatch repair protein MutL